MIFRAAKSHSLHRLAAFLCDLLRRFATSLCIPRTYENVKSFGCELSRHFVATAFIRAGNQRRSHFKSDLRTHRTPKALRAKLLPSVGLFRASFGSAHCRPPCAGVPASLSHAPITDHSSSFSLGNRSFNNGCGFEGNSSTSRNFFVIARERTSTSSILRDA